MAWTAPTASDFKQRFPAFGAVADPVVTQALAEAARMVDESWVSEDDFKLGRMLLAAHYLVLDGHGTGAESELGAAGALGFSRMKSGQLELQRSENSGGNTASEFSVTSYGTRFLALLNRNKPAVMVVGPVV
jgi:hypothetical protein